LHVLNLIKESDLLFFHSCIFYKKQNKAKQANKKNKETYKNKMADKLYMTQPCLLGLFYLYIYKLTLQLTITIQTTPLSNPTLQNTEMAMTLEDRNLGSSLA